MHLLNLRNKRFSFQLHLKTQCIPFPLSLTVHLFDNLQPFHPRFPGRRSEKPRLKGQGQKPSSICLNSAFYQYLSRLCKCFFSSFLEPHPLWILQDSTSSSHVYLNTRW